MPKINIIRWTVESASKNFDVDQKTLKKNIGTAGIVVGDDGKFSTLDICKAIFGDLKGDLIRAQTRNQNEMADISAVKKANLLRQNIPAELIEKIWSSVTIELRQKILYAEMPDKAKQDILKDLMALPVDEYFNDAKISDEEAEM